MALNALSHYTDAISCLDRCLEIDPIAEVFYAKGTILMDIDRDDEALNCFTNALKINSHMTDLLINMGVVTF